jgi:hypothetical protein
MGSLTAEEERVEGKEGESVKFFPGVELSTVDTT